SASVACRRAPASANAASPKSRTSSARSRSRGSPSARMSALQAIAFHQSDEVSPRDAKVVRGAGLVAAVARQRLLDERPLQGGDRRGEADVVLERPVLADARGQEVLADEPVVAGDNDQALDLVFE